MGLTSLSVVLAVVLLNVHLYGSALKPVPRRLRRILFHHIAPFLHVRLHRATAANDQKNPRRSSNVNGTARRMTTIYNAVFLNDTDLPSNSPHTFHSTTIADQMPTNFNNPQATPQTLRECKRLLTDLNRIVLRPTETNDEDKIVRDWQNVALVMDRCLFYLYILSTAILTVLTLLLAPLFKTVPTPPEYFQLNITRE